MCVCIAVAVEVMRARGRTNAVARGIAARVPRAYSKRELTQSVVKAFVVGALLALLLSSFGASKQRWSEWSSCLATQSSSSKLDTHESYEWQFIGSSGQERDLSCEDHRVPLHHGDLRIATSARRNPA